MGYDQPGEQRDLIGRTQSCNFENSARTREVNLAPWGDRDLLVDTYRTRLLPIFVPTEIEQLPAVVQLSTPDAVICTITTGTANGQALETTLSVGARSNGQPDGDPCREAMEVIRVVVGNLPPLR